MKLVVLLVINIQFLSHQDIVVVLANFLDVANCRHYVAANILMGYVDEHDKEFVIAKGRGRPKGARGALKK